MLAIVERTRALGVHVTGLILGIESTAHTLSFGSVDTNGSLFPSNSSLFRPDEGGIHPREAADHHVDSASSLLDSMVSSEDFSWDSVVAIAFSQGPGLGPCLRIGASIARSLSNSLGVPLIGVNHCVAHIEIGRNQTGCSNPVFLYVSGGNTQVISLSDGRYRVLGETLDIGIGNMLDKFARIHGISFPGGPEIERLASMYLLNGEPDIKSVMLPYGVHGMDIAFSGMLTSAIQKVSDGIPLGHVCWSLQEHSFATCIEVAERALAHTGKDELLLGGGVACNTRLREMSSIMTNERGAKSYWPEKQYCIDNGTMIAELGRRMLECGINTTMPNSAINPVLRTDNTDVLWA
ncbi:MAG TPA: bifunctional N(6)-L-threonylcarbamoyladenine synthase/serine/threonine protein kinase [Candidatus Thalassarchaeaceae archaeon]|jgi:glycoprotease/Kae1 family metallohydrolase|nr:bifunctional N(6)-L-threonylcarbamoyladenine synthase/serine/threonine protein kinase [Candidatus Thalassarchaeaceae archaeon]|tara:strand:- start:119606 stop:120655 length:1050 start_codon:yes stop_codon:yes gene_type:complete